MTKHLFIVNPIAGGKDSTEDVRRAVERVFCGREEEYEVYVTKRAMDAPEKIRSEAGECEHLRVYACGGDGTFNECVCGAAGLDNAAVCPFPTGTGNDFCRMFGEEKDLYRDLEALVEGGETPIDLIDCNGRYSANICSVGIDARIGTEVHKYSSLPLIGGAAAYVVSAVVNVFKGITRKMHIVADEFDETGDYTLVCACNGRYYGGGFNPSATARPDDGILDIFIVKKISLFTLARLIGQYAAGKADKFPQYIKHLRGKNIDISFEEENVINLDGEAVFSKRASMHLIRNAVRLIVPKGMRFFAKTESAASAPLVMSQKV